MSVGCVSTQHRRDWGAGSCQPLALFDNVVSKFFLLTPINSVQQHFFVLLDTINSSDTCLGVGGGARELPNLAGKPSPPSMWLE